MFDHPNKFFGDVISVVRAVRSTGSQNVVKMRKNQAIQSVLKAKMPKVSFGDRPIFANSSLSQPLKSRKSAFGHLAFSSNLPSFHDLSNASKPVNESKPHSETDFFYIKKKVVSVSDEVPTILKAVGLRKLKFDAPKCYGKKKIGKNITMESVNCSSNVTLDEQQFFCDYFFGKLD